MNISGPDRSSRLNQYSGQQTRLHLKSSSPLDGDFQSHLNSSSSNKDFRVVQGIVVDDSTNQSSPQASPGAAFNSPYYQHLVKSQVQAQAAQSRSTQAEDPIAQRVQRIEKEIRELKTLLSDNRSALDPNASLPSRYSGHARSYSSLVEGLGDLRNHIANA